MNSDGIFQKVFLYANDGIFVADNNEKIVFWNKKAEKIFGYKSSEVIGKKCQTILSTGSLHGEIKRCFYDFISTGEDAINEETIELKAIRNNGEEFPVEISISTLEIDAKQVIIGIIRDISERKRAEEAIHHNNFKLHAMVYEYCLRYQSVELLNKMSKELQSHIFLEDAYSTIKDFAVKLFPSTSGALFIYDPLHNIVEAQSVWGREINENITFLPECCLAIREGSIHITPQSNSNVHCAHLSDASDRRSLCVPLTIQGKTLGALHIIQKKSQGSKEELDKSHKERKEHFQQLALIVADYLAMSLTNIKLRDSLHKQAIRDPLTGLFNRRYMEETLEREIHRSIRRKIPLALVMIDIDHFRRFNNTYGHDAGDTVLRELGAFLQKNIRKEDAVFRYGGEEFTLMMSGASADTAHKRAEELRISIEKIKIHHKSFVFDGITISLGVAAFPLNGSTWEVVLQAADSALYAAKNAGRNKVVMA